MKRILVVLTLVSGCFVRRAPVTPNEECAGVGMVADGMTIGSGRGTTVSMRGDVSVTNMRTSGVQCRRPATPAEMCELQAAGAALAEKSDYLSVRGRNAAIGIGYLFFIVPGAIAYFVIASNRDDAVRRASEAGSRAASQCGSEAM